MSLNYLCNGDAMFHVNKGIIGYKLDGVKNIYLYNIELENVINIGNKGSSLNGDYDYDHGHF